MRFSGFINKIDSTTNLDTSTIRVYCASCIKRKRWIITLHDSSPNFILSCLEPPSVSCCRIYWSNWSCSIWSVGGTSCSHTTESRFCKFCWTLTISVQLVCNIILICNRDWLFRINFEGIIFMRTSDPVYFN